MVRTGSRGLFWLEPMVEVATAEGRVAYGPVTVADISGLLGAGMLTGGPASAAPWSAGGNAVPRPPDAPDLRPLRHRRSAVDGRLSRAWRMKGSARANEIGPAATIELVTQSGLRGRGGAGFPTGIKWKTAADAQGERKFIVCNADEGDSGTFADRMLMEGDPFVLIEGMAIAGFAVGATKGYVYTRSEYPHAIATFNAALRCCAAGSGGLLGAHASTSSSVSAAAPTCAAKRPRCSTAWRASAARYAPSRRCPRIKGLFGSADRDQQRGVAGQRADHPGARRGVLSRDRHGPFARHDADPASPATSDMAGCSNAASASRWANW